MRGKLQVRLKQAIGNKMKKIYLYVLDDMAEWEIGNIPQALSMELQLKQGRQDYRIHTISHDGKPVKTLATSPLHLTNRSRYSRTIVQLLCCCLEQIPGSMNRTSQSWI